MKRKLAGMAVVIGLGACGWTHAELLGEKTVSNRGDQYSVRQLSGRDDTLPGEVTTAYPTLEHLAVEWEIEGDDNLNGTVGVRFRASGVDAWRIGMPLRRVPKQTWYDEQPGNSAIPDFTWANKHSGSLFGLEPGTAYEIELNLADPDGGQATRTVRAKTRPVPRAAADARVVDVTPETLADRAAKAQPGDILLLAPGNYGYFAMPVDGAPGKPVVLRGMSRIARHGDAVYVEDGHRVSSAGISSREGEVVFEGISLHNRKHVYLEGLVSFGTITLWDAEDCVVRRCRVLGIWGITAAAYGGLTRWSPNTIQSFGRPMPDYSAPPSIPRTKATNCYIADNIVTGITPWAREVIGAKGKNIGEGIEITGPGNVICYNRVIGFRDNISTMEGSLTVEQHCIDIYNNDIEFGADDGIEFDYFMSNCRALRNRISNCHRGISAGPGFGGPLYITHNVFYNTLVHPYDPNRAAAGVVILHNTSVKSGAPGSWEFGSSYLLFENNLAIGGGTGSRSTLVLPANAMIASHDYNGFGIVGGPLVGELGGKRFEGISALQAIGHEPHAVEVGLDVFATPPDFPDPAFPARPVPDLRLAENSPAIDAARPIPNINDGFMGSAPDIGAHELGQALPIYGPRPFGEDL